MKKLLIFTIIFFYLAILVLAQEPSKKILSLKSIGQIGINKSGQSVKVKLAECIRQDAAHAFSELRIYSGNMQIWGEYLSWQDGPYVCLDNRLLISRPINVNENITFFLGEIYKYNYSTDSIEKIKEIRSTRNFQNNSSMAKPLYLNSNLCKKIASNILEVERKNDLIITASTIEKAVEDYCKKKVSPGWGKGNFYHYKIEIDNWASIRVGTPSDHRGLLFLLKKENNSWQVIRWDSDTSMSLLDANKIGCQPGILKKLNWHVVGTDQ